MTTLTYHTCSPWILGLHTLPIFLFLLISYNLPEKLALSVLLPGKKSYLIFQYRLKCCILHNVLIHFFNLEYMPLLCFHVAKFLVPALQTMTIRDVNDFLKGWFISSMLQPSFVVVFFVTASMCSDDIIYAQIFFVLDCEFIKHKEQFFSFVLFSSYNASNKCFWRKGSTNTKT